MREVLNLDYDTMYVFCSLIPATVVHSIVGIEGNKTLMEMIINSKIETIKNMEEK